MSFELLSDQRKVRKRINSKIHSVYKMQPVCRLEALSHIRGGTSALKTGWSSLGRGTGRSIQAAGPLWTLSVPPCFSAHISLLWLASWCSILCLFWGAQQLPLGFNLCGSGLSLQHLHTAAVLFWLPDVTKPLDLLKAEACLSLQTQSHSLASSLPLGQVHTRSRHQL